MKTRAKALPDIRADVQALRGLFPSSDPSRLLDHDSMRVYYDVRRSAEGVFSLTELPTTAARADLILPAIQDLLARVGGGSVVDLACSPGYFMFKLAELGVKDVVGVDAREDHRDQFRLLNSFYRHEGLRFVHSDMYDFLDGEARAGRKYDVCLLFGFLYHTATPVELLRKVREVCRGALLVDTTLSLRDDVSLLVYEERTEWSRASTSRISMMPSLRAVPKLLEAAGFRGIERVLPAPELAGANPGGDKIDYYFDQGPANGAAARLAPGWLLAAGKKLRLGPRGRGSRRALFKAFV